MLNLISCDNSFLPLSLVSIKLKLNKKQCKPMDIIAGRLMNVKACFLSFPTQKANEFRFIS